MSMAIKQRELTVGRPSLYRGKNRDKPIQIYMTDEGRTALDRGCRREGLSRPDYIEKLVLERDKWARNTKAGIKQFEERKAVETTAG
jgi:hypothetical protein